MTNAKAPDKSNKNGGGRRLIGEVLVEAGLVTEGQLSEALAAQKESGAKIVSCLVALGHLDPQKFVKFLSRLPGVASIDLSNYEIERDLLAVISRDFAVKHEVMPIDRLGKLLTLGMVVPLDRSTIDEIQERTGLHVKPLLCSSQDISEAIHRYYPEEGGDKQRGTPVDSIKGLKAPIKLAGAAQLVRRIDSLPALPETVERVREAMIDPDVNIPDVARIVTMDPPIAAKVLSVANSAAYGFRNRVEDITLAISLMGLRETYSIVLAAAVLDLVEKSKNFDYKQFWLRSMACAAAAKLVARSCGRKDRVGVFTAGLLHCIGRVALAEVAPAAYAKVDASLVGLELIAEEERVLGVSHPEAGFQLAEHWELPAEIAQAIRFYHNPAAAPEGNELVPMVGLAAVLATVTGPPPEDSQVLFAGSGDALSALGLDAVAAREVLNEYLAQRDTVLGSN